MNTNTPWRTFSIFISSTFADMQAERDYLKNIVFPRVEEELRKKRIRLETVDLRWGVDTSSVNEDEREATVLKVCLEEIERCKPFFIGLLGDRYGWVPPEEKIENATKGRKLLLPNKGKSVTALEIEFGVLASTEQLNRSIFYLREPLPYDKLSPEKAANFSDQYDPVLTEEEKRIRKETLDNLKEAIKSHVNRINLPGKVKTYSTALSKDSKAVVCGLESWGETVYTDILAECEKHAEDTWGEVPKDHHEQELALLEAFIEEHTHITTTITEKGEEQVHTFCGRKELIKELKEHLLSADKDKWGLVLTGESGSGKSAVFSMMYKIIMNEDCLVLAHSAGISPRAKSVAELLKKWNMQLREFLGIKEEKEQDITGIDERRLHAGDMQKTSQKTGIEKLQEQFAELLWQASEKKRIVLLIDALDLFEPTSRAEYMTWLPGLLPGNVRLLVTAITGTEKNAVQYHKGLTIRGIDYFTKEEAKEMLHSLGRKLHKNLPADVEKEILEKKREDGLKACSSPLWLSLAVNILMTMDADDFEKMSGLKGKGDEQISSYMLNMVKRYPGLPGALFLNLIEKATGLFGGPFTTTLFNLIACSRSGLRESDLERLLPKQTTEIWDSLRFANLRRWFRVHLVEQGEGHQWNLAHFILRNILREKMAPENFKNLHTVIGNHLLLLSAKDALRITETMYYLLQMDDKLPAIEYYVSDLEDESLGSATRILCEMITSVETGLKTVASFPSLVADHKDILSVMLHRFVFELNNFLAEEGNLKQRLTLFNYLGDVLEKLSRIRNSTLDIRYNKAVLNERIGSIYLVMGQFEDALKYYVEVVKLFKELYEANPRNESYNSGLAIAYNRIGGINKEMGHMEEALSYFEKELSLCKELFEDNPHDVSIKNGLAISYSRYGYMNQVMGNAEEALDCYLKYNKLEKELCEDNPHDLSLKDGLAISYQRLGDINQEIGHMEEAFNYFEKELKLAQELFKANPRNESLKLGLAISYVNIGDIHEAMGHIEEALDCYIKYHQLGNELYGANPSNNEIKNNLAVSHGRLGDIHKSMGKMEEALNYYLHYSQLERELYEANPRNVNLVEGLGISLYKLSMLYKAMGDDDKGKEKFSQCKTIISILTENLPQVPSYGKWNNLNY